MPLVDLGANTKLSAVRMIEAVASARRSFRQHLFMILFPLGRCRTGRGPALWYSRTGISESPSAVIVVGS